MTDIALLWQNDHADIAMSGANLQTDEGLDTAVVLSLFVDRRADPDDGIALEDDPRGWWADSFAGGDLIGSKLWLLGREKNLPGVARRARGYAEQALAWLVDDGIASAVTVQATFTATDTLALSIAIERPRQLPFNRQYQYVWSAV